jgi:hypothetical protein
MHEQIREVGGGVERSGTRLAPIYAHHWHGDHRFATAHRLERFPDAISYATDGTIRLMHQQPTEARQQRTDLDFPGLIPHTPVVNPPGGRPRQ